MEKTRVGEKRVTGQVLRNEMKNGVKKKTLYAVTAVGSW